jgi:flagellar motor protein MotB
MNYEIYSVPKYQIKHEDAKKVEKQIDSIVALINGKDLQFHERFFENDNLKLFIDVEHYKSYNPEKTFNVILNDICDYVGITVNEISYTTNLFHEDGSHHIVIPKYCMLNHLQKKYWQTFVKKYGYNTNCDRKKKEFDLSVYGNKDTGKWFRLPNQTKEKKIGTEHVIQKGDTEDFILKYVEKSIPMTTKNKTAKKTVVLNLDEVVEKESFDDVKEDVKEEIFEKEETKEEIIKNVDGLDMHNDEIEYFINNKGFDFGTGSQNDYITFGSYLKSICSDEHGFRLFELATIVCGSENKKKEYPQKWNGIKLLENDVEKCINIIRKRVDKKVHEEWTTLQSKILKQQWDSMDEIQHVDEKQEKELQKLKERQEKELQKLKEKQENELQKEHAQLNKQEQKEKEKIEKQQQKEQEKLEKQQQKEQEKLEKQQQKEQERLQKQQLKEREKDIKKQQLSLKKEEKLENDFSDVSKQFQENHFKIRNKSSFVKLLDGKFIVMSRNQLLTSYEDMVYNDFDEKGKIIKKNFIFDWLKNNPDQKTYDDMECYPNESICPENIFNTWIPFAMEKVTEWTHNENGLQAILSHIKILCGNDDVSYNYMLSWIAQMIQCPWTKTICPIFISKEGAGKGTLMRILSKMIGDHKYFETSNPSQHIWGQFNGALSNAYLVNIDELSKKDTILFEGMIKGLITNPYLTINNKGVSSYPITSYHRFIITTNNEDPVKTKEDDRRKFINRCSDELINNVEYFKKINEYIDDVNVIKTCYEFFKSYVYKTKNEKGEEIEITMDYFNKIPLPVTEFHRDMKESNMSPIEMWVKSFALENFNEQKIELFSSEQYDFFKMWCVKCGIEYHISTVQFGVRLKNLKISGIDKGKHTNVGDTKIFFPMQILAHFKIETPVCVEESKEDSKSASSNK